ncbi:MAG: beta-hexosaminidase [Flavobacteriaceae bacterium]|nr:MAG: beta-hexosaminidase [Flavobacteriaceae bacterium]
MRFIYSLFILVLLASCSEQGPTFNQENIAIIPQPNALKLLEGSFKIEASTKIYAQTEEQLNAANLLNKLLKNSSGYTLEISENDGSGIKFNQDTSIAKEGYTLQVSPTEITINANDAAGYLYAIQTIRQLLPSTIEKKTSSIQTWFVPSVNISDSPRFKWRGMHMDFSRHFFSLEEVKLFLDHMALYKLNKYHMHLTDDQGWRVEIKKYPLLTEKGAWRTENANDKHCNEMAKTNPLFIIDPQHFQEKEGLKKYGGFFTQTQIKEIITYAGDLNIEVIPEIDMPGHFKAAIDNYPYLSCTGEAGWGEQFSRPACLGKQQSFEFAKDILSEIAELFPSEYIHIGGDEVNIQSWEECANCQKAIVKNGLKNEHELQSYFNKDIADFLHSKGKRLLGWDEIAEGGLSSDATVMWWRNWAPKARDITVNNGSDLIITPDFEYYFDFTHESTPLSKVYNYEPVPALFNPKQVAHVIGIQANLWSERIPNFKRLQYQAFPRLQGLAETAWSSKEQKDFEDFSNRLESHYPRMDALNINYYIPSVLGLANKIAFIDKAIIKLKAPIDGMEIYYTLDGTQPSNTTTKYTTPLEITEDTNIQVIVYKGAIFSEIKSASIEKQVFTDAVSIQATVGKIKRQGFKIKAKSVEHVSFDDNNPSTLVTEINLGEFENKEHIALQFNGYFKAENEGLYEFSTKSDDGSLLYIGTQLVVDNGGNHAGIVREGMIALKKGWHPITIKYHQGGGGSELAVWFKGPTKEKQLLQGAFIGY